MMQLGHYPLTNLRYLLQNLREESSPIVLELLYKIMHRAQSNWLPLSLAPEVNLDMAEFYLNKAHDADEGDVEM
jgi:hypothetical protein